MAFKAMSRARSYSNLGAADGRFHRRVRFSHSRKPSPCVCHQPSLDTPLQISAGRLRCANCRTTPHIEAPREATGCSSIRSATDAERGS